MSPVALLGADTQHQDALHTTRRLLGLRRQQPGTVPLHQVLATGPPPRVCLSYGLGVDSTAILTRLLTEDTVRDFSLDELVVLTAGTGQEWPRSLDLVTRHVLPLLARRGVRFLQVARCGPRESDGVAVLGDSRAPGILNLVGAWTLADEMLDAGTVPQTCGTRKCSLHFKGFALDTVIAAITRGNTYRHIIGYATGEQARATRDAQFNTEVRTGEYPLITWEWDRQRSLRYLHDVYGESWEKSACPYCPFALSTKDGQMATVDRFIADPHAGLLALAMEHTATALNSTQGLIRGDRLLTLLRRHSPRTRAVLELFEEYLHTAPWALYELRRAYTPRQDERFNTTRSVRIHATGTHATMRTALIETAELAGVPIQIGDTRFSDDEHPRAWKRHRATPAPGALPVGDAEHFFTIAPATAISKTGPSFTTAWATAHQHTLV